MSLGGDASSDSTRRAISHHRWHFVHQVHGNRVVNVEELAGGPEDADGIVAAAQGVVLAVLGADCALVGLASPEGVIAAVHAGWRGLVSGVIGEAAAKMRARGATRIEAVLSACVHPECYPFSEGDLDQAAAVLGEAVRGKSAAGSLAFDLPRAVRSALTGNRIELVAEDDSCTACGGEWFSVRSRGDLSRQLLAIWREP
jgi:polyphenol oxidase